MGYHQRNSFLNSIRDTEDGQLRTCFVDEVEPSWTMLRMIYATGTTPLNNQHIDETELQTCVRSVGLEFERHLALSQTLPMEKSFRIMAKTALKLPSTDYLSN
jgi:hypothetical protein